MSTLTRWPLTSTVIVCVTPLVIFYLLTQSSLPVELLVSVGVAVEVVFLTHVVGRSATEFRHRRNFASSLWILHHEMSAHYELSEVSLSSLGSGTQVEKTPEEGLPIISAPMIHALPDDAWDQFRAIGGLQDLLDYAPQQTVANLYRYYHGVRLYNENLALRQRLLELLVGLSGPSQEFTVKNIRLAENRMEEWFREEVPSRLLVLSQELQNVLLDLGQVPVYGVARAGQYDRIRPMISRETNRYYRWRHRRGLPPPPDDAEWEDSAEVDGSD